MASITSWYQLLPRSRTELAQRTLEARVHDPLWLLARQWQFGEFKGEDAGSAIGARLRGDYTVLQRYYPGALPVKDFAHVAPYDSAVPLETLVEREHVRTRHFVTPTLEMRVEAGLQFLRLLGPTLGGKYRPGFVAAYPVSPLTQEQRASLDAESVRAFDFAAPRAVDGMSLYAELKSSLHPDDGSKGQLPGAPPIAAAHEPLVRAAAETWLGWYESLFSEPDGANASWQRERLEYAFAVSGDAPNGEVVLSAAEYCEGHLDWHSFDLASGTLHAPGDAPKPIAEPVVLHTIPSPIGYRGMPSDRWWEFEESRVNFGAADAGPADLGRMLMIEFAVIYGNDWFIIPIKLPVGSVFQTRSLVVTDTFGVRMLVPPSIAKQTPGQSWRMFELTGSDANHNVFFLAPSLVNNLHSEPLEEVLFARDEMANMAWAIEKLIEGPAGSRIDRLSHYRIQREEQRRALEASTPKPTQPETTLHYRLASEVPAPWIPLIPQQVDQGTGNIRLRRGAMLMPDGSNQLAVAQGRILSGNELSLYEEEVPRSGVRVTRSYQHARWIGGSTHLWMGRRKQPGRGEASSGLIFDSIRKG